MDEAFEAITGTGIWGVAVAAVAGVAIVGTRGGKPLLKTAIKGYLRGSDWVRTRVAESSEGLQDLYAEARYEHRSSKTTGATAESPAKATSSA